MIYVFVLILFVGLLLSFLASLRRKKSEKDHAYDLTFLQIKMPPDNEYEIKTAEHMFSGLSALRKPFLSALFTGQYRISFEIVSKDEGIGFYVVVPDEVATLVEKQISGAYPEAEIDIVNPREVWDRGDFTKVTELKLSGAEYSPIKVYEDLKGDPLNPITAAMSKLSINEVVAIQYVITPAGNSWRMAGKKFISSVKAKAANTEKNYNVDTSYLEGIEKKVAYPAFDVALRIVSIAENDHAAQVHINNMVSAFEQFTDVNYNRFVTRTSMFYNRFRKNLVDNFIYRKINVKKLALPLLNISLYRNTAVLNIVEMASVFHFPNKEIQTPKILWLDARKSAAPINLPGENEGIWIGQSVFRGVKKEIHITQKDRTRHFYIIGQTGTGKSELLKYMALQDIRNGEGVAVIDPHGTDVQDLLNKMPPERAEDVIYFNAADTERPMGINMLEHNTKEEQHLIVNAFIALLYKLYDPGHTGIIGPQLEQAVRNSMLTAMVDPESTLVDVRRLVIDGNYAKKYMDKLEDPIVRQYWEEIIANTTAHTRSEKLGYMSSKFDNFTTNLLIRNIIGQPHSAFNLPDVMAKKKILLVDLAKGKIGEENSNFLGLLLVPKILGSALARHSQLEKGEDFPDFYLYVDEFQNFATPDFATILSEARKYKLNLTVAHQFVAQLDEKIKDAIFGNVGSMCTFRVGTEDAEFLENYYSPNFTKKDISNLPIGNCYTRLLVNGHPSPPFSMTQPWDVIHTNVPSNPELGKQVKELSRTMYGVPVAEVDEYIKHRSGVYEQKEEKPQPKRRIPF